MSLVSLRGAGDPVAGGLVIGKRPRRDFPAVNPVSLVRQEPIQQIPDSQAVALDSRRSPRVHALDPNLHDIGAVQQVSFVGSVDPRLSPVSVVIDARPLDYEKRESCELETALGWLAGVVDIHPTRGRL
jgi:hypothetical protein